MVKVHGSMISEYDADSVQSNGVHVYYRVYYLVAMSGVPREEVAGIQWFWRHVGGEFSSRSSTTPQ